MCLATVAVSIERDRIDWAQGRGLSKESYFSRLNKETGFVAYRFTHVPSTLLQGTKVGIRNHDEIYQNSSRVTIHPSGNRTGDPSLQK